MRLTQFGLIKNGDAFNEVKRVNLELRDMMKRVLIILGILAFMGGIKAQTPGENIDVTHYELRLSNFNFVDHTLQGEAFVTLHATASTSTIVLELKSLTVASVLCNATGVESFNQEADFLTIHLTEALNAGQEVTLDILYGGNTFSETWGGVEWWGSDYVYNLGVGFDSQPHNLGKTWFPCVDDFVDKATYDLYITVDNDKKAICGGNHIGNIDNGDGTNTWHWEVPQEVATYHVSFTIGDYMLWDDTYHGIERDIPVEVYVKPAQIDKVEGTFANVKGIAAFYEENFGPYPFNRIGYICTGKGCMEHIDNIALTPGVITGNTSEEEYVAHELSHMYFGNKVTCSTAGDMWLNEGFAQFCGLFYRIGVYGEDDFQGAMSTKINSITGWCKNQNNWIPLNNMPLDMTYDGTAIYNRGAVIINTMMNYMGRENFLIGLRHYLDTYAYGAASSEQLRDALTEATGIDMNGFFDTYVFTGGMPHFDIDLLEVIPNGTHYGARIQMNYQHIGPEHVGQNNRVEVTFIGANGQTHTELVGWDGLEMEDTINLDFEPVGAFVDYYNRFLEGKTDKNLMVTSPINLNISNNFLATVNSVTDSTLLRIEEHYVGPENEIEIPGITLSSRRYWNFFRNDFGDADVTAMIAFSKSLNQDDDIIHSENDSAVLLYRPYGRGIWFSIPYTQEGNWKKGRFIVDDAPSGQYAVGVFDKTQIGLNENSEPAIKIYPNPTNGLIMGPTGEYRITNFSGQTLIKGTTQGLIDVSCLCAGTYFITINGKTEKFILQ